MSIYVILKNNIIEFLFESDWKKRTEFGIVVFLINKTSANV